MIYDVIKMVQLFMVQDVLKEKELLLKKLLKDTCVR